MRLTLRTLLAWLDDTLSPAEVREIGKQVSESQFAQDIVERIQRVTRQRRLTVPSSTGPDATDPNLVASYLDNELDQDLVPEYEKLCLTSDVHMAEVASAHQVLSLIGQKAKVPNEAKHRMYNLIKGREAIASRRPSTPPAAEPVSEPIGAWVSAPLPGRPWLERYGPAAAAVGLLAILCWSAWMSLKQASQPPSELAGAVNANPAIPADRPTAVAEARPRPAVPELPTATAEGTGTEKATEGATTDEASKEKDNAPRTEFAPGIIGMTEKANGVLLRYNTERREWEQLGDPSPLRSQDRMLGLDPFRSTLVLGTAKVDLVGETEILLGSASRDEAARFQLGQGRVALHGATPGQPFHVQLAGKNVMIIPPAGSSVGVERLSRFEPGSPESAGSVLRVYASGGDVALAVDDAKKTLTGPGSIVWDGVKWADQEERPGPDWVTDTRPTAYELQVGEQFLRYIRPNRPIITDIVEALDDDQKDVRRLALRALRAVGDLSYITPVLNKADDPTSRREAVRVLRAALAQGPDSFNAVHEQLRRDFGDEQGKLIEKLLVGFTAKDGRDPAIYTTLVQQLSAPDVGIRELALDNLRGLTGRDDLQYDPDKPTGPGLRAWHDLLREHELRPAASLGKSEK